MYCLHELIDIISFPHSSFLPYSNFLAYLVFNLGLTARQDFFTHFEQNRSLDGGGDFLDKTPDQPQSELVQHVTKARHEATLVKYR